MNTPNYKEPIVSEDGKNYQCANCEQKTKHVSFIKNKGWVCNECFGECRSCGLKGGGNE